MRWSGRGQAAVEFALVLPVLIAIIALFIGLAFALQAQSTVASVATTIAQQAASAGGENAAVDALVRTVASQNGLALDRLAVRIDTASGTGGWHDASTPDDSHAYPPLAPWGTPVQVHLRYAYTLSLPLLGSRTLLLAGEGSGISTYGQDVQP